MSAIRFGKLLFAAAATALIVGIGAQPGLAQSSLLNVSYDPTRELYRDYNQVFAQYWRAAHHQAVRIQQSHGGSGTQARSVIDGLQADVVTLGIPSDINAIQRRGLIAPAWAARLPDNSTPYWSTVVFLVRKGNPKHIHDWADLARPGVSVITPNPKTSSGGRWNFLAAWGAALRRSHGSAPAARAFIAKLYKNVPVLDTGARGATDTFVQRGVGDVLLNWENDAELEAKKLNTGKFEIIYPSLSILAEPAVAVVDKNAAKHRTTALATAYLHYLYSQPGQEIIARNYFRPRDPKIAKKYAKQFPAISLFTAEKVFGGWDQIQKQYFANGGIYDQATGR